MELILCAKKAFAVNLESSLLHKFVNINFSWGIQFKYIFLSASIAAISSPPINTLSGHWRSFIAVPSARNSGLDNTEKLFLFLWQSEESRISFMVCAVLTGKVLFSTTIVWPSAISLIFLAHDSTHLKSLVSPAPNPFFFIGVFTDIKIISALLMAFSKSVEKIIFFPLTTLIISDNPGSKTGSFPKSSLFHALILFWLISTTSNSISGQFLANTAMVGPPTYPAPIQQIFFTEYKLNCKFRLTLTSSS